MVRNNTWITIRSPDHLKTERLRSINRNLSVLTPSLNKVKDEKEETAQVISIARRTVTHSLQRSESCSNFITNLKLSQDLIKNSTQKIRFPRNQQTKNIKKRFIFKNRRSSYSNLGSSEFISSDSEEEIEIKVVHSELEPFTEDSSSKQYRFANGGASKDNASSKENQSQKNKKISNLEKPYILSDSSSLSFLEEVFEYKEPNDINREDLEDDDNIISEDSSMLSIEKIMLENKNQERESVCSYKANRKYAKFSFLSSESSSETKSVVQARLERKIKMRSKFRPLLDF